MVKIDIEYLGDLHCKATHGPSGSSFLTDAPVDNQGKGEYFSPTDLAATSIGSCIATIMGITAKNHSFDIKGLKISVEKEMVQKPVRRIGRLKLDISFPRKLSEQEFRLLSAAVDACPVSKSLHPDVEIERSFHYPED